MRLWCSWRHNVGNKGAYLAIVAGAVSGVSLSGARHGGCFIGYGIALETKCRKYKEIKRRIEGERG